MTPQTPADDAHPFAPFLQEGEQLLWVGQPNPTFYSVRLRQRIVRIFIGYTMLSAIGSVLTAFNHRLLLSTEWFIVLTLLSAAYLLYLKRSQPSLSTKNYRWYAVSNKHVLEYTMTGEDPLTAIPFGQIQELMITLATDNVGSVNFVKGTARTYLVCLTDIDGAREVCELIRATAQRNIPIIEKH